MTTTRSDQVAARRAELLEATRKVALARGLANTRVADVAAETKVSGGLIHYHFASKEALLTEMVRWAAGADIELAQHIVSEEGGAVSRLDSLLQYWLPEEGVDENWTLWIDAWGSGLRDPALAAISAELDAVWVGVIEAIVRDGQRAGEFGGGDPHGVAIRLGALLDGLSIRYTLGRSPRLPKLLEHARIAAARELDIDPATLLNRGTNT